MPDAPCIFGPDGFPVSSNRYNYSQGYGGGRHLEGANNFDGKRPSWQVTSDSINRLVPPNDFRTTVAISDKLIANTDIIKGAFRSKADFCVGDAFLPRFEGGAKDWGLETGRWLHEVFYPLSNLNGDGMHDLRTDLTVGSERIDAVGSFGVMLGEFDGGFPALQYIPTWRLFNGDAVSSVTTLRTEKAPDGTYLNDAHEVQEFTLNGKLLIFNGIIYNPVGMRKLYYRIRLEDSDNPLSQSREWVDIHASDFIYAYDPEFHEGLVGWPVATASIGKLRDALQSHEWEQLSMLANSALVFTEHNETGGASGIDETKNILLKQGVSPGVANALSGMRSQEWLGGMIRYFKANSGSKIESHSSQRPGDSWENLQDRIYDAALRGAGWPLMGWSKENPGGQMSRASQGQCRNTILRRQKILRRVVRRCLGYAVSKAIKIKAVKEYPGDDAGGLLKWGVTLPALMSIDDGRDSDNRRKDYDKGFRNDDDIFADLGVGDPEAHWADRARYVSMRKRAAVLESRKPENVLLGVTVDDRDMSLITPNEQPDGQDGSGDSKSETDGTPSKKDPTK